MENKNHTPCWILCTPRTGSTFLCELLNQLKVFPAFNHPSIENHTGNLIAKEQAFNEWPRLYNELTEFIKFPPPHCKMIYHQYLEVLNSVPNKEKQQIGWYEKNKENQLLKLQDCEFVKNIFPDIKFILLQRNPIEQAASLYFARHTKKYHIYNEQELEEYLDIKIEEDQSKLLAAYKDALFFNSCWDGFLKNQQHLKIKYEKLINQTKETLESIMNFLEIQADCENIKTNRIKRMTRPEASQFEILIKKVTKMNLQI